jgi:pimeloyl-ACP methyl ester carboxylesterase
MPHIEVAPKIRLFVEDQGSGKPVVFLHGWPFDHQLFTHLIPFLPGCRFIGVDLRGYGKSDKPDALYSYDLFARDLSKILAYLDLKNVSLVGFSMGGAVALHYVHRYATECIKKLVLIAPTAPCYVKKSDYPYGFEISSLDRFDQACQTNHPLLLRHFLNQFFSQKNPQTQQFSKWLHQLGQQASMQAMLMSLNQMRDIDLRPILKYISIPTAIFHAKNDLICPYTFGEQLHHAIKNSQFVHFEKSGHGLFFEEKEKFCDELLKFVHA